MFFSENKETILTASINSSHEIGTASRHELKYGLYTQKE